MARSKLAAISKWRLVVLVLSLVLVTLPGCLTMALLETDVDMEIPECAPDLMAVGGILVLALAFDVVTFPYQYAKGYYPYGDRRCPED